MMAPDQHCEEWGGLLWDRAFRRGTSWRFNHFSYSSPTAHFPSPAYGEARDGALATAPRGGRGGGAFSPFSVVVAVGPSRGGRSGGHKRQLGWDASQDSRRRLLAESVTDEAASNTARAGRGG